MQDIIDMNLEDLESQLYSYVYHSNESWDQQNSVPDLNTVVHNSRPNVNRYCYSENHLRTRNYTENNSRPRNYTENDFTTRNYTENHSTTLNYTESDSRTPNYTENNSRTFLYTGNNSRTPNYSNHILKIPDVQFRTFTPNSNKKRKNKKNPHKITEEFRKRLAYELMQSAKKCQIVNNVFAVDDFNKNVQIDTKTVDNVTNDTNVIELSDSDSDDVVEVPLPPKPPPEVLMVVSSDDEENLEKNIKSDESENIQLKSDETDVNVDKNNVVVENKNDCTTQDENIEKNEEQLQNINNINQSNSKDNLRTKEENHLNVSINSIEQERNELLCTPDSNTNDFIENDVNHLSKNSSGFNFVLHGSDLDLHNKEITKSTQVSSVDVYETESSCSEAGTITKSRPIFNEIDFESPNKEIFCEPDLDSFSKFITPVRSNEAAKRNFSPIKTRALLQQSDLEYNSDATTLQVKKKQKKKKKKLKTKNEESAPISTEKINDLTNSDTNLNDSVIDSYFADDVFSMSSDDNFDSCDISTAENFSFLKTWNENLKLNRSNDTSNCNLDKQQLNDTNNTSKQLSDNRSDNTILLPVSSEMSPDNQEILKSNVPEKNNESTAENFSFLKTWNENVKLNRSNDTSNCNLDKQQLNDTNNTSKQLSDNRSDNTILLPVSSEMSPDNQEISKSNVPEKNNETISDIVLNVSSQDSTSKDFSSSANHSPTPGKSEMVKNPFSMSSLKTRFSDIFTYDMRKFYDESWGHEEYNVDKVISSMPADSSKWGIIREDKIKMQSRRRKGPICSRCKESGHVKMYCQRYPGPDKCSLCGSAGHLHSRCPNTCCTTCGGKNNYHTTTCYRCAHYKTIRCTLCNIIGHQFKDCPDMWRRYHSTTKDNGLLVRNDVQLKPFNQRWCPNCAQRGHFQYKCNYIRLQHFPTLPHIISYEPTYNNNNKPMINLQPNIEIQEPPISVLNNRANLSEIRNYKHCLISNNNKKYLNILKRLKHIAYNKADYQFLHEIKRMETNLRDREISRDNIRDIYRMRNALEKSHNLMV